MPDSVNTPADLRTGQRQKVLKTGKILLPDRIGAIDCSVRDLSASGAKIIVGSAETIPDAFRLVLPGDRSMRDAVVAWRTPGIMGVKFTSEPRKAPLFKW